MGRHKDRSFDMESYDFELSEAVITQPHFYCRNDRLNGQNVEMRDRKSRMQNLHK